MRDRGDYYEYIAVMVDDLLIFSKEPLSIIEALQKLWGYTLKGVGTPEYYSGADIEWDKGRQCWTLGAKTYIKSVCDRIEKLLETSLKNSGLPLDAGDHPEMDDTDLLVPSEIPIHQMMIGCLQWAVRLGRYNVQYATNTLARFGQKPRDGHLKRALRVFGYLKFHARGKLYLIRPLSPMKILISRMRIGRNVTLIPKSISTKIFQKRRLIPYLLQYSRMHVMPLALILEGVSPAY